MLRTTSYEEISLMPPGSGGNPCLRWMKTNKKILIIVSIFVVIALTLGIGLGLYYKGGIFKEERHKCADTAEKIINEALYGPSLAYSRLGYLCNTFGNRFSGSASLEAALAWIVDEMKNDTLDNPHHEPVMVPRWIRGKEYLTMLSPFERSFAMLGLGNSVSSNGELTARVIVVSSYADLVSKSQLVPGNIVLYNVPFTTYGETVQYRSTGAIEASKYGAVGALLRSVTPFSLYTPHTGNTRYNTSITAIPFAAVTVEDAIWMQSLYDSNENITVSLYMEAHSLPDSLSSNIMSQITGSVSPNSIVAIGGHTDSWDVGQGAMDDGGGVLVSWEAVRLLHSLGLKPKRTIRVVGWVNEENGLRGGIQYALDHQNETHVFAIESDGGATTPLGLQVHDATTDEALETLQAIAKLLKPVGATTVQRGGGGADVDPLTYLKTPVAGLWTDTSKYFWYHHTNADTFDKMDEVQMRQCVATMAVMSYCVADADVDLPRLP